MSLAFAAPSTAADYELRIAPLAAAKPLVVEVRMPPADIDRLRAAKAIDWPPILSVRVVDGKSELVGKYAILAGTVRFESRFPPSPGVTIHVRFNAGKLPGRDSGPTLTASASLAVPKKVNATQLLALYPSGDTLAENHLRFYLHFSAPMRRGDSYHHVHLLGPDGKKVVEAFLELGEELWDPTGTRLTLLFNPGRIKRGLKPREDLGPILEDGKRYTLVVDGSWPDADGQAIHAGLRRTFSVGPPDDTQPDIAIWKLTPPKAESRAPLRIKFPEPLDRAMLQWALRVVDAEGKPVEGVVDVRENETIWQFEPSVAWVKGGYRLRVDPALEDRSGNSITRPFELDLVQPRPSRKEKEVELMFEVK